MELIYLLINGMELLRLSGLVLLSWLPSRGALAHGLLHKN
jgi:hypothetical protein